MFEAGELLDEVELVSFVLVLETGELLDDVEISVVVCVTTKEINTNNAKIVKYLILKLFKSILVILFLIQLKQYLYIIKSCRNIILVFSV